MYVSFEVNVWFMFFGARWCYISCMICLVLAWFIILNELYMHTCIIHLHVKFLPSQPTVLPLKPSNVYMLTVVKMLNRNTIIQ